MNDISKIKKRAIHILLYTIFILSIVLSYQIGTENGIDEGRLEYKVLVVKTYTAISNRIMKIESDNEEATKMKLFGMSIMTELIKYTVFNERIIFGKIIGDKNIKKQKKQKLDTLNNKMKNERDKYAELGFFK